MSAAMSPACVLVLDGETTQALAAVRSLARAGHRVLVASHRRYPLAAASRFCVARHLLRAIDLGAYRALREWARERGVEVVLPVTERSCVLLNLEAEAWRTSGIVLGCGSEEMLRPAFDKAETVRRAVECGIAVPPTRILTSLADVHEAARTLRKPWVVKARFSNSWHGARFISDPGVAYVDREDALLPTVQARRQGAHWPILQEFVPGKGKGVFALCDHGRVVLWFAHERLRDVRPSGSGSSLRRSIPLDPRLRDAAATLLADLAWHGPAMLEFRDDGTSPPRLMEVNGRFWGSLQLAISAGADFPRLWLCLLRGEPLPATPPYREGLVLRWFWGDVKRLFHLMKGAPPGFPGAYPGLSHGLREILGPQPRGTRHEIWDREDPLPVVAEWLQGFAGDFLPRIIGARRASAPPAEAVG